MKKPQVRVDDFETRRQHLTTLTDEELKQRFWQLSNQVVDPLLDLAKRYTSPSIERSVLMRMGFSSLEAKAITDVVLEHHLLAKGAGGVVYRNHLLSQKSIREAGLALLEPHGMDQVLAYYEVKHGRT